MDDLPKSQNDDLTSFAGSYPDDTTKPAQPAWDSGNLAVPPAPVSAEPAPPAPFATEPLPPVVPAPVESVPVSPAPTVSAAPTFDPFAPGQTSQFDQTPVSPPSSPATDQFAAAVLPTENPFTYNADNTPPPPKKRGIKRVLMIVFLLLALLLLGFVGFTTIGKLLTQNKEIVLNYWGLWEQEQALTPLVEEYRKTHPNIQIAYTRYNPKQYRERLQSAIARGEGPDMFRYHATWLPMLREDLAPAGKTGYTADEFMKTFYPVAAQDLIVGGSVYGVPLMIDGLGLYYNEDLLRSAGVTPPTSWEAFRQAAVSLTVKDETGKIITAGAALGTTGNIEHFSDILATMMLQNGADLKNPTSTEAQQALSFYRLFAEQPGNVWDETLDNSILAFAGGKVAFIFAPSWQVFTIREINPQLNFRVIPIPQLPGTNITWATYWAEGVSSKSQHKEEAWEFLKFLSSKESLTKLYTEQAKLRPFGEPYSRVDLAQTLTDDPYVGAYMRQAATAQSFFLTSRTFDNGINDRMIKYLEDAVNSQERGVSPQAALSTAAQGFAQVLSSFGFSTPVQSPAAQ